MIDFTIADAVVILILGVSGLLAYSRGLTREALALGGWIVAAFAGLYFVPLIEPLILEIPTVGPLLGDNCIISKITAFSAIFAIALIILSIFTPLFSNAIQESALGPIDRGFGFFFGALRGLALVALLFMVYDVIVPASDRIEMIDNARTAEMMHQAAAMLRENAPTSLPNFIAEPLGNLMSDCGGLPGLENSDEASLAIPAITAG